MAKSWIGYGIRRCKDGVTLDVTYSNIQESNTVLSDIANSTETGFYVTNQETAVSNGLPYVSGENTYADIDCGVFVLKDDSLAVETAEEGYFKLQLISQRLVQPHGVNLAGVFGKLENLAWSNYGPIRLQDVDALRIEKLGCATPLSITHVDKFPYMVNYHIPSGIRIADAGRARLGAYLGEGTTIMPAGYINFNAGTEGNAMVEGRISGGVFVSKDSDIGGGASIMGTLSGGNDHIITIGSKCLLGANSGTGISLGYGCTIQAGVYVTAGMKVSLLDKHNNPVDIDGNHVEKGQNIVKAMALSGKDYLLFIQDSQTGEVICKPNTKIIALNEELHANN